MRVRTVLLAVALIILAPPVALTATLAVAGWRWDRSDHFITYGDARRGYRLHVPPGLDGARPVPLVISLHGAGGGPAMQEHASGWDRLADAHGFIVAYPAGTGFPRIFPEEGGALRADVRFLRDLIDTLRAHHPIDTTRIYADGLSNGGGMVFAVSCTMADRVAAVGAVAAAELQGPAWCPDPAPVPVIAFHGTADRIVPYAGGRTWRTPAPKPFPNIPAFMAAWAARNRCAPAPAESLVAPHVSRRSYVDCAEGADVVLYTIIDGGHSWPGGEVGLEWWVGPTNREVDASALMWDFYQAHPLRQRAPAPR